MFLNKTLEHHLSYIYDQIEIYADALLFSVQTVKLLLKCFSHGGLDLILGKKSLFQKMCTDKFNFIFNFMYNFQFLKPLINQHVNPQKDPHWFNPSIRRRTEEVWTYYSPLSKQNLLQLALMQLNYSLDSNSFLLRV